MDTKSIKPGTKFYCVEWYDTFFKTPPFSEPKLRSITFHRKGDNEHVGEFIDDTGRAFIYAYYNLNDWYSPTPQAAYERHLRELHAAVSRTEDEIRKQRSWIKEFRRQISLSLDKIKESYGTA